MPTICIDLSRSEYQVLKNWARDEMSSDVQEAARALLQRALETVQDEAQYEIEDDEDDGEETDEDEDAEDDAIN